MGLALVAGCGDDGAAGVQTVAGAGYRFEAPGDWKIERAGRALSVVEDGGSATVSVTSFRLARPYRPGLWRPVVRELDQVADRLARALGGVVSARATVEIGGQRARRYDLSNTRDGTRRLGFVLRARREYQLLCRGAPDPEPACEQLFATFRLT